jgi:hypothetical protein
MNNCFMLFSIYFSPYNILTFLCQVKVWQGVTATPTSCWVARLCFDSFTEKGHSAIEITTLTVNTKNKRWQKAQVQHAIKDSRALSRVQLEILLPKKPVFNLFKSYFISYFTYYLYRTITVSEHNLILW